MTYKKRSVPVFPEAVNKANILEAILINSENNTLVTKWSEIVIRQNFYTEWRQKYKKELLEGALTIYRAKHLSIWELQIQGEIILYSLFVRQKCGLYRRTVKKK